MKLLTCGNEKEQTIQLLIQSFFIHQDKPSLKNGENVAFGNEH
jgi:hypothetical protein